MARSATDQIDYVWARMPGTYLGRELDRGQVIPKLGSPKDDRLKELGYLPDYEMKGEPFKCPECGADFIEDVWRRGHFEKRHAEKIDPLPYRQDGESDVAYAERVAVWKERQAEIEARKQEREMLQMPPHFEKSLANTRG